MNTNILVTANGLSDRDLLARLDALAGRERAASAELVAHLAALDSRPPFTPPRATARSSVIAPRPFGSRKTRPAAASRPPGPAGAFRSSSTGSLRESCR